MPSVKLLDPSVFVPGLVVRRAKSRRYGIVESVDRDNDTAQVAWFESEPGFTVEQQHQAPRKSGKATSLQYLIPHNGPIPEQRLSM